MNEKTINNNKDVINDLYLFYRHFITSKFETNTHAPHIDKLSVELMKIKNNFYNRLCVAMPPRHSKSSMITLAYPLWLIFQNPDLNILIINNTGTLSEKFGIKIRESIREIGSLFNVYLSNIKHSSTHIMFCDVNKNLYQGSIRLVGAGGSITGQDADYIIVDDPYKGLDEEFTPTALEKKINWFNTIVEQRLEPNGKLIILHTRWHTNDIIGHIKTKNKSNSKYKFIEFPAIDKDGSPLWKERYTSDFLIDKKNTMGERLFSSIYQQKPLDDTSDFFNLNKVNWLRPKGEIVGKCRGWDIASGEDVIISDFTAGVPMYVIDGDKILITDFVHGQFGSETKDKILSTSSEDGVDSTVLIETGVAAAGKLLFNEWEQQLRGYMVEQAIPMTSKVDRATPLQHAITDGKIYVDIIDENLRKTFIDEFKAFPNGAHDDIVDATAHAFNYMNENYLALNEAPLYIDF